jgi:hypothetical protein
MLEQLQNWNLNTNAMDKQSWKISVLTETQLFIFVMWIFFIRTVLLIDGTIITIFFIFTVESGRG